MDVPIKPVREEFVSHMVQGEAMYVRRGVYQSSKKEKGRCVTHGSKDLNKSPKVQPNANVTPSAPSCQSINYKDEDEEELNSWIWRSYRKTK